AAVREAHGRFRHAVSDGERQQDRYLGDPDSRDRRRRRRDLYLLPPGLTRRLQGRLGRNPGASARLSLPPLQFRRDHAAARRAFAARKELGRKPATTWRDDRQAPMAIRPPTETDW